MKLSDVLENVFGVPMDEALAVYGADVDLELKRFEGHGKNFGFHRWSYSDDLKKRTCVLCGKCEPSPILLFLPYRKKVKKSMGLLLR